MCLEPPFVIPALPGVVTAVSRVYAAAVAAIMVVAGHVVVLVDGF